MVLEIRYYFFICEFIMYISVIYSTYIVLVRGGIELNPGPKNNTDLKSTESEQSSGSQHLITSFIQRKPDKRSRMFSPEQQEDYRLLSSGEEEISRDEIKHQLDILNEKFDKLLDTINAGNERIAMRIGKIESDLAEDLPKIKLLEKRIYSLESELVHKSEKNISELDNPNRENIIFWGMQRRNGEDLRALIGELFKAMELKIDILGVFTFPTKDNTSKIPIICRLVNFRDKYQIFKKSKQLAKLGIGLSNDYPKHIREIRKKLKPHLIKARNEGKRAFLRYTSLIINDNSYSLINDNELNLDIKIQEFRRKEPIILEKENEISIENETMETQEKNGTGDSIL